MIAGLLVALLGALLLSHYMQPRFEGKTVGEWIYAFPIMVDWAGNESFNDEPLLKEVAEAGRGIRGLGDRCVPKLEEELRATDSRLGLARWSLEIRLANTLRRNPSYVPAAMRRARAMAALRELPEVGVRYVGRAQGGGNE